MQTHPQTARLRQEGPWDLFLGDVGAAGLGARLEDLPGPSLSAPVLGLRTR